MPFGIAAAIGGAVASTAAAVGITVGATAAAAIGTGIVGAGIGALGSAITGGDPLTGALTGGLSGGLAAGFGPSLSAATGLGGGAAGGLLGAAGGALGSAIGGGNPLTGAITGGIGGYGVGANAAANAAASGANTGGFPTSDSYASGLQSGVANPVTSADLAGAAGATGVGSAVSSAAGPVAGQAAAAASKGGGNLLGGLTTSDILKLGLGVVAAGAASAAKPVQGTYATPGPSSTQQSAYQTAGLNQPGLTSGDTSGRTALNPFAGGQQSTYGIYGSPAATTQQTPGASPYWQYGGPEQTFFQNNSLANFGFSKGGALNRAVFDSRYSDPHVRGPGTPTSDSIPARLSKGEYVLDYKDVALLGGGSNEKGARKLDAARRKLNRGDKRGALETLAGGR